MLEAQKPEASRTVSRLDECVCVLQAHVGKMSEFCQQLKMRETQREEERERESERSNCILESRAKIAFYTCYTHVILTTIIQTEYFICIFCT